MTIGVAAVLTMIAIGTGAEGAIEDQIRAAGMNLIVVTAGNYKMKSTEDIGGAAVEPSAALRDREDTEVGGARTAQNRPQGGDPGATQFPEKPVGFLGATPAPPPRNEPMEKNQHPTAQQ